MRTVEREHFIAVHGHQYRRCAGVTKGGTQCRHHLWVELAGVVMCDQHTHQGTEPPKLYRAPERREEIRRERDLGNMTDLGGGAYLTRKVDTEP